MRNHFGVLVPMEQTGYKALRSLYPLIAFIFIES